MYTASDAKAEGGIGLGLIAASGGEIGSAATGLAGALGAGSAATIGGMLGAALSAIALPVGIGLVAHTLYKIYKES